jgi:tetratricopeptide (TPR) repeat protein
MMSTDSVSDVYRRAMECVHRRDYDAALLLLDEAIRMNPSSPGLWSDKGAVLYELNRHDESIRCFEKAIGFDDTLITAWYNKGLAFTMLQRYDEAIACLIRVSKIDPQMVKKELAEVISKKSDGLNAKGLYHEAMKCCDRALDYDPDLADAWNNRGYASYYLREYDEAIRCFRQAIELAPLDPVPWSNLAAAFRRVMRLRDSRICEERADRLRTSAG